MFTLFASIIILCLLLVMDRLRSIQKRALTELRFVRFETSVMDYLRSEDPGLSPDDYSKLKYMITLNDRLARIYGRKRSSTFHAINFINFVRLMRNPKQAYQMDLEIKEFKSENPNVLRAKSSLDRLITWTVFYNTSILVKIMVVFFLVVELLCHVVSSKTVHTVGGFYTWYKDVLAKYIREDFDRRLTIFSNFRSWFNTNGPLYNA